MLCEPSEESSEEEELKVSSSESDSESISVSSSRTDGTPAYAQDIQTATPTSTIA
jgi:hypothetical protein